MIFFVKSPPVSTDYQSAEQLFSKKLIPHALII